MIYAKIAGIIILVAIGSICWMAAFHVPLILGFSQVGFCPSVEELMKPDRHCPPPLWYWLGNISVPLLLTLAGIRKIRMILEGTDF